MKKLFTVSLVGKFGVEYLHSEPLQAREALQRARWFMGVANSEPLLSVRMNTPRGVATYYRDWSDSGRWKLDCLWLMPGLDVQSKVEEW